MDIFDKTEERKERKKEIEMQKEETFSVNIKKVCKTEKATCVNQFQHQRRT